MQFLSLIIFIGFIANQFQLFVPLDFGLLDIAADIDCVSLLRFLFAIQIGESEANSSNY